MDERAINGAAIEAVRDLAVDCEIKEVCKGSGADEWCVRFSGKYGRFCDNFQNQFGKENSPEVMREKIKAFLIKQVAKIRSSTGRKRKPAAGADRGESDTAGGLLSGPINLVSEMLGRATGMAGRVISQATEVAETASAALSAADLETTPPEATVLQSSTGEETGEAPPPVAGRTVIRAAPPRPKKAAKRAAGPKPKPTKKAGATAAKAGGRAKKAAKKAARKASRKSSRGK